ncbi:hypothetical protein SAMN05877809_105100 [Rhodobacter sp. JA431]|uniref:hypothetical protein n=1 Tax=Rhodobacter sp. JA431 TaxID=570013 RepID=UPI000BDA688A|nr:hypothetical protein [Rhodobacter sp. JA431]SOC10300.1 hypothetical protein SAMN05877809_105100 [Rhodobacter sp. JA431]
MGHDASDKLIKSLCKLTFLPIFGTLCAKEQSTKDITMKSFVKPLLAVALIAACGGPAVNGPAGQSDDTETGTGTSDVSSLEGTGTSSYVQRYEGTEAEGAARGIVYDSASDTIRVDNLPFDGSNTPYTRSSDLASIGGSTLLSDPSATPAFRVYEAPDQVTDFVTGDPIPQMTYRAIYGESINQVNGKPRSSFAIVRTGSYNEYGFGGFVFERNGTVKIPMPTTTSTSGATQGVFTGDYAGIVDFDGSGGLVYVSGDAQMTVDFQDFNDQTNLGDGVRAQISGRRYYSLTGTDITGNYLDALNSDLGYASGAGLTSVPILQFQIQAGGVMNSNGEMEGSAYAQAPTSSGTATSYQQGNFYAVISGDASSTDNEIVGIVVVEGALGNSGTARETGGFIVYRGANN